MTLFEYKVIPAPGKGRKGPGIKGAEARFAYGLEQAMNELGAAGWEYQRSDILPSEERAGLTSSHTVYRSVLVFRRPITADIDPAETVAPSTMELEPESEPELESEPDSVSEPAPEPSAEPSPDPKPEMHEAEPEDSEEAARPL